MKRKSFTWFAFAFAACGPKPTATTSHTDASSVVVATPACLTARDARTKASKLDRDGHEMLALVKLDEANSTCPAERAATAALEMKLLANVNQCTRARALAGVPLADRAASKEVIATCDVREAPPKGDEKTMRAKMREAYRSERTKDFSHAKALYLEAWAESHPNARAIEDAARMASLAGDRAESRRLRDRALAEAESSEHATATLTGRIRVAHGMPELVGNVLTLANGGKVVSRDLVTGEMRVMVDAAGGDTRLSPMGTLAVSSPSVNLRNPRAVYDVLTGALLFRIPNVGHFVIAPDDSAIAVSDDDTSGKAPDSHARIYDAVTGELKTKITGKWRSGLEMLAFAPDASNILFFGDTDDSMFRQYDLVKNAYTSVRLIADLGVAAVSSDGHIVAYIEKLGDGAPLHVRDMVANKDLVAWAGSFHSVEALAVSNDGKFVATGSRNSLRLWDTTQKKQLFVHQANYHATSEFDPRYANEYAFSDDAKSMVLAGTAVATSWDVATGVEKPLVVDAPPRNVLRVVQAPEGVAIVTEEEVRVVPSNGEPRVVCKGLPQPYSPIIGPTSVAFSSSGKSFACGMSDGWVHVFDTATWTERAVIKKAAPSPIARPVDLVLSPDDAMLTVVADGGIVWYDAKTGAETKRVALKHPASLGLAPRHARFDDGSIAIRLWNGSAAIFRADGAWQRDVKLVSAAPIDALDSFASNGTTYAVAVGKTLHVVDLASGEDHPVALASTPKTVAVSPDGKTVVVANTDETIATISGGAVTPLAHATGSRAGFAGKSTLVWRAKDVLDIFAPTSTAPLTLEVDAAGVTARDMAGAFEVRGKPELACVVGKTYVTRETCKDRATSGLVADWVRNARN